MWELTQKGVSANARMARFIAGGGRADTIRYLAIPRWLWPAWSRCLDRRGPARSLGTTGSESTVAVSIRRAETARRRDGERGSSTGYLVRHQAGQGMPGSRFVVSYSAFSDRRSLAARCGTGATASREPNGQRRRQDRTPSPRDHSCSSGAGSPGGDILRPPRLSLGVDVDLDVLGGPQPDSSCWRIAAGCLEPPSGA
jgi:hypothetical protein